MLDRFLLWLKKRESYRLIDRSGVPYLGRHFLFRTVWFSIMIHELHSSDDPDPHCHPWWNFTWVLRHGMREHYHDGTYEWLGKGAWRLRSARELHWLEKTTEDPPITLFIRFKRQRKWGFIHRDTQFKVVEQHPGDKLTGVLFPHF